MSETNLIEENMCVLTLIQAMIGAISSNIRRVSLKLVSPRHIELYFLLHDESLQDREEIDDIAFEFEALQERSVQIDLHITIDSRPIHLYPMPGRVVFGRWEPGY